ncbi:hypothetical protein V8D89_007636 [Ganoderma adspersum]
MFTPTEANKPGKLDPTPHYPHIVLALNLIPGSGSGSRFHWFIFVPDPGQGDEKVQTGIKIHVTDFFPVFNRATVRMWQFQDTAFTLATSASGVAAAIVGHLTENKTVQQLVDLLREIPMSVPEVDIDREPDFSCRVWVREALRRLHGAGFIDCLDVIALENEMQGYGKPAAIAVKNGTFKLAELVRAVNPRTPTDGLHFVSPRP